MGDLKPVLEDQLLSIGRSQVHGSLFGNFLEGIAGAILVGAA